MVPESDLPNSSQFSPIQTPLPDLLLLVKEHQPDRAQVTSAIQARFFSTSPAPDISRNTVYAMSEYGIIDPLARSETAITLSPLGESLAAKAELGEFAAMYDEFAVHILLNRRGLDLLTTADDLARSGQTPTKALIVEELKRRGIYHPPNGTHANGMRQWLEQAGVVDRVQWVPKQDQLERLLGGANLDILESYANLTTEQRAFARAFARLNVDEARSNKVAAYAAELFSVTFPEGGLPQSVLFALQDAGLIRAEKTTSGQGAKPYVVRPTDKLRNELIEPVLEALEGSIGVQYRALIRMRLPDILSGLKAESKNEKGKALEALAFYLARLLRLDFVQWRLRSNKTGGAELDVVMEGAHLVFSRWQIQCKNASEASLEDIAKEVGIAQVIKANVILIVTTGRIGKAARTFAEQVMRETNLYVALLDGQDLVRLQESPADILEIMQTQAKGAMAIKKEQVIV